MFVNPPYGPELQAWLEKISAEAASGTAVIALLPVNRTEQQYWQATAARANAVCWVLKRVPFLRPSTRKKAKSNPYCSLILGFNVDWPRFEVAFGSLGHCREFARAAA